MHPKMACDCNFIIYTMIRPKRRMLLRSVATLLHKWKRRCGRNTSLRRCFLLRLWTRSPKLKINMRTVRIGNLEIGKIPRVVATLASLEAMKRFEALDMKPCDIAEVRLDLIGP